MIHRRLPGAAAALVATMLLAACGAVPATPVPTPPEPTPTNGQPTPTAPAVTPAAPEPPTPEPVEPLTVVASTTVLADLVRQVGGERVSVHAVIPPGRDVHTFEPAPSDAARFSEAELVVINGLELDDWLEDLALEVAGDVALVALGEGLEGVEYLEGHDHHHPDDDEHEDEHEEHEDEHGHDGAINPHLWLDVSNTRRYVEKLTATLVALDPDGREAYEANSADFDARLAKLDDWIRQQIGALPEENRRVVSFHDAFPYFAHAYGIEIVGVVVESVGQEPSAGEVARLITAISEANVRAILTEVQFSDRLAQAIASDTGVNVVHDLYTDSLGDPPLDTYEGAMRWNVERIVEGLG